MAFASAERIYRDLSELVRSPRRIPISECAAKSLYLEGRGGNATLWDANLTPYLKEPMDCLSSRHYESVIFAAPARTGKTAAFLDAWILYAVSCNPGDMLLVFPTQTLAEDYSKRRLSRLHTNCQDISDRLSARAHDTALRSVTYKHGMILTLAWPTSSQLAQRDIRYVALTDLDSMPEDIGGEGEAFGLAKKRTQHYLSCGKTVAESSPKRPIVDPRWTPSSPHEAPPVDGGILSLYNRGDRRRWYWRCLHCQEPFEAPALPAYDDTSDLSVAAKSAHVPCPHCGGIHRPSDKRALNLSGSWVREPGHGENNMASFWLLGCAAAYQSWDSLVLEYLRAKREFEITGNEEALRRTVNTDQGIPYLPAAMASIRDKNRIVEDADEFDRGIVPDKATFLAAYADVQARRFVVQVHAIGPDAIWIIDRYDLSMSNRIQANGEPEAVDPATRPEDWRLLIDVVLNSKYPVSGTDGENLAVRTLLVDSGGRAGVTANAYAFYRYCKRAGMTSRVCLVKGMGGSLDSLLNAPQTKLTFPDSANRKDRGADARGEVPVLLMNPILLKDKLDGIMKSDKETRKVRYASWLGADVIAELCAEIRTPKGWRKVTDSAHNEAWDLLYYCLGHLHYLGSQDWGDQWESAPDWARNRMIASTDGPHVVANTEKHKVKELTPAAARHAELMARLRRR